MAIRVQCFCGKSIEVPDKFAGRHGRCKACGAPLDVPAINVPTSTEDEVPEMIDTEALEPLVPVNVVVDEDNEFDSARAVQPPAFMPKEPWYYGFLSGYAGFLFGLGLLQFVVVMVVSLLVLFTWGTKTEEAATSVARFLAMLVPIGISFSVLIGFWLISAPILLAVDAARNLRAMRWKQKN